MTEIYYVEDDENISRIVKAFLEQRDYKASVFRTITDVKQAMKNTCPDMALVDRNMPDGSGNTLCQWIRLIYKELPVIFLTVRGDTGAIVSGFQNGADDYVVKPFELDVLHSRIRALHKRAGNMSKQYLFCDS